MTKLLNSAFDSVVTDENLDRNDLLTLGKQLRSLSTKNVTTLTVPLKYYNYNKNGVTASVLWDPVLAGELFTKLRNDEPLVEKIKPTPSPNSSEEPAKPIIIDKFGVEAASTNPCKGFK